MAGFCQSQQNTSAPPVWADPLGPTSTGRGGVARYGTSGAPQYRSGLFNYMSGVSPEMYGAASDLASGLQTAAGSSFFPAAEREASNTLAGNYLSGSPQLNAAMAANTAGQIAQAQDENARVKSDFTRSGMRYSTGMEQAAQGNVTNAAAQAGRTNAMTQLQNYQTERQNQQNAPAMYTAAQSAPFNYLSQVSSALMNPASLQGNLLSALSSGGQTITPNVSEMYTPSMGANILTGLGAAQSLASTLTGGLMPGPGGGGGGGGSGSGSGAATGGLMAALGGM